MAEVAEPDRRSVVSSNSKVTKERRRRAIPLIAPATSPEDSSAEELWFDLLLDLALAATYSNLSSNTSVYTEIDALSYIGFFMLLWWIWTSQVCYNARFRQNDWVHRIYLILQLCVFGALSTFTANFDVSDQILDTGGPDSLTLLNATLIGSNDYTSNSIILDAARRKQLPPINNRGISGALGCSRLILLVPYVLVWVRTRNSPKPNTSVLPIIASLIFSSAMHFTTYGLLTGGGRNEAIAKVVLWYSSILIEVIAHYVDIGFQQGRSYPMDSDLFNRASTLMTVIVGEGVNQITGAFHYIVGNIGVNGYTLFNMVCTAAIVFCQFTLYFEGGSTPSHHNFSAFSKLGIEASKRFNRNFRALTWLISHALYFACLILFMQSVTSILAFQNLQTAANEVFDGLHQVEQIIVGPGAFVPPIEREDLLTSSLSGLGVPWGPVKEFFTNTSIPQPDRLNAYYKFEGQLYWYLASLFGSAPEPDSDESFAFQNFTASVNVTRDDYHAIVGNIFTPRARSTLWLPGSSGGTLIALGLLNAIQRHPPDVYAWLSLFIRLSVGSLVVLSTIGNNGSEPYPLFDDPSSAVWRFLKSGWLLPALAAIYIVQVAFDYILVYTAVKRANIAAKRRSKRASTTGSVAPSNNGDDGYPDDKEVDPSVASPDYADPPPFTPSSGKFMMSPSQLDRNGGATAVNTPSDENPNYSNSGPSPIIASPLSPKQRKLLSKIDSSSRASSSSDIHGADRPHPLRPTSRTGRQVSIVETPKASSRRQSFVEPNSAPASRRPSMSAASSDGERPSRSYLNSDTVDEPQLSRSYAPVETIGSGTVPGVGKMSLLEQAAMSPKLERRHSGKLEKKEKRKSLTISDGASSMRPSEMSRTPSRKLQRKSGHQPPDIQYPGIDRPQATYNWD